MGVVDELVRARQSYERGDWAAAYEVWTDVAPEAPTDLIRMAMSAVLRGRHDQAVETLQRGFHAASEAGDHATACRCAFHLGMLFSEVGEQQLGSGWASRAQRELTALGPDTVESAYVEHLLMFRSLAEDDFPAALGHADETLRIARAHGDPDLTTMGMAAVGRLGLYAGRVVEGLALFDEALAAVAAGEVSPVFAGHVYCVMIEGCQDVSDLGRAAAWTAALSRWAESQPALLAFTGQCAVHRGQIFRLHGAFTAALEEYEAAVVRYLAEPSTSAAGLALAESGDLHRLLGDLDAAERSYEQAADQGFEPQPGLALLWLAQGREAAAVAAVRRLLSEREDAVGRSKLLPGAIEVLLAARDVPVARELARELEQVAAAFGSDALRAAAAYAAGAVELADGDASGALPYLRTALSGWRGLSASYEAARCRALVGRCLRALGDEESAVRELTAACRTFGQVGATPAARAVEAELHGVRDLPDGLTAREVEVLALVASGRSNAQIAGVLVLSEKTVARHLSNIFTKIGVGSRTAAAAYAFEHGLA
jgi:DNA-binding CsgD family transcriptional regulator/tetratricopeptide (TPR) repeat protein